MIPASRAGDGCGEIPAGQPTQLLLGPISHEMQQTCLMGSSLLGDIAPTGGPGPMRQQLFHQLLHRPIGRRFWSEVIRLAVAKGLRVKPLGQQQITGQRLKHMLPGAGRQSIANAA